MKQKWFKQGCRGCFVASVSAWLVLAIYPVCIWADEWTGAWSLQLESNTPAWMSIRETNGKPTVKLRLHVGPDGPHKVKTRGVSVCREKNPSRPKNSPGPDEGEIWSADFTL